MTSDETATDASFDLRQATITALERVTSALPGGGEHRAGQQQMAELVATALTEQAHAVVQAGTGTGKSLAYLVPAVLSGKTTVIATATKALQDQLATKDLPFLEQQLGVDFSYGVLKGRSNYLCRQRLDELERDGQSSLDLDPDGEHDATTIGPALLEQLKAFDRRSVTGDRSELADVSDQAWRLVSVGRDECPGAARCPRGEDCFAEQARTQAAMVDVLVVNLHLYALAVLVEGVLPEHDLIIMDEAHQVEDIVAEAAGRQISPRRVQAAARATAGILEDIEPSRAAEDTATSLHAALERRIGERLSDGLDDDLVAVLDTVRSAADGLLNALRSVPDSAPAEARTKAIRARQLATGLVDDIDAVRWPLDQEVLWIDGPASNPSLRTTPIAVGDLLASRLWSQRSAVLTSATLSTTITESLGLPDTTVTADVGSPFDYQTNALLYCPTDLPDPRTADYRSHQHDEIERLISAAGGRTLALFTSFSAMNEAVLHLQGRLPWTVLVQGEQSKHALLQSFIDDEESCLFATMSFWQGVDAPGSTCRLVIIDRLPFPRPTDPVLQARRDRAGSAAFRTIDLPRAATMLAQGAGRLIRASTDRGVVAVLDPRLATARSYRWELINSLPPMRRTADREEATTFLRSLRDGG